MSESGFSLFARPSFWEGMARLLDFAGTLNEYNTSDTPEEADYRALLADWEAVGLDIYDAVERFARDHQKDIVYG